MKKKLPEMLNVISIMTIGWSSMILISGVINSFILSGNISQFQEALGEAKESTEVESNPMLEWALGMADNVLDYAEILNLNTILVCILSITAALLMRKLMKLGFWIYILATLTEICVPFIILKDPLTAGLVISGSVFSILFVILYSVNYKELTK